MSAENTLRIVLFTWICKKSIDNSAVGCYNDFEVSIR